MSERQKNKLLSIYLIMVNSGMKVSEGFRRAIEKIENERISAKVATL